MQKLNVLLSIGIALLAFSCGNSENTNNQETTDSTTVETQISSISKEFKPIELLVFDTETLNEREKGIAEVEIKGNIIDGKRWIDANGENIVFFSEQTILNNSKEGLGTSTRELHAYHYKQNESDYELIREVQDFTKNCGFENRARFMEESISVTDLDMNGVGEISFAYRLGCSSELSPDGLKLIMLENGKKYAIRGNTLAQFGPDEIYGGEMNIDPSFEIAHESFLKHATEVFKTNQNHNLVLKPRPYLLKAISYYADAKLGGVEPNWNIKIHDNYLIFSLGMGSEEIRFDYKEISQIQNGFRISAQKPSGGTDSYISVDITNKQCSDGMSENVYPISVYASYSSKQFYGCGKLNQK